MIWQTNVSATKNLHKQYQNYMKYQLKISHISTEMFSLFPKSPNFSLCPECLH